MCVVLACFSSDKHGCDVLRIIPITFPLETRRLAPEEASTLSVSGTEK